MTDLTLNTRLTADASGLNAALRDGAGGVRQFSQQAEAAAKQQAQVGQQAAAAAQAQAAAAGVQAAALRAQQEAMRRARAEANLLANANRMLPMQITDIATSLASGMPFWMVAIQQGGQLRDSYNGVLPAGRAILGLLTPMRLALGGAAAGVGLLTAAFFAGQAESQAYTRAVALSGGAAGATAGQLNEMAKAVEASVGTQAQAAAVLAKLAEGGRVTQSSLQGVAETVVRMERDLGIATDEAVGMFEALGREPVKAAAKLNEQFNFLTLGVYEQIKALQEQGREAEAAALAQRTFSEAMNGRAKATEAQLGYMQRAWRFLGEEASKAWSKMLNVGRTETLQERLADVNKRLEEQRKVIESKQYAKGGFGALGLRQFEQDRQEQAELQEQLRLERKAAEAEAAAAAKARKAIEDDLNRKAPKAPEIDRGNAIADAEEEIAQRIQAYWQRNQEALDAYDQAAVDAAVREAVRLEESNRALGNEIQSMGLTGRALLDLEQARISSAITTLEQARASAQAERGLAAETDAIDRQIAALRERQGLLAQRAVRQDQVDQQRTADQARQQEEADAKRRTEAFADSISQGILEGYRQGRSLTDVFLAELRAQFAKTVLQPVIQPLAQSGSDLLSMLINGAINLLGGGGAEGSMTDPNDTGAPGPRAGGGRMEPYGDYWVGEQGPERVRMGGRGAYVYPAHASLGSGSGRGGQQLVQNTTIHVGDRVDAAQVYGMALQAARAANAELVDAMNRGEV